MVGEKIRLGKRSKVHQLFKKPKDGFGIVYYLIPSRRVTMKTGYVGITQRSMISRLKDHMSNNSGCHAIHSALHCHGDVNFSIVILEEHVPASMLGEREKLWIREFDTYRRGYNLTEGGDSNPMHCEMTRMKHKDVMSSKEFIERAAVKRSETFLTEEYKQRTSQVHMDSWASGRVDREQHRQSILESWMKPERRNTNKHIWDSEEARGRQLDGMRAHFELKNDPSATKEQIAEAKRLRGIEAARRYRERKRALRRT